LARECPDGDCVIAKTEQFLAVLKDPNADKDAKAQAFRFAMYRGVGIKLYIDFIFW
jgi:hypothetical protein